jgi:predicted transcriptional regulator of viral defense system
MSSREKYFTLFRLAAEQGGYFTAQQARAVGYAYPAHHYHVAAGNWEHVRHGLYRLRDYPLPEHADLIEVSLRLADHQGRPRAVFSHETGLVLHELSDANPDRLHVTVPPHFRHPLETQLVVYRVKLEENEWEQHDGYRVTTPLRTLLDIAASDISWPYLEDAVAQALERGLVQRHHLRVATGKKKVRARLEAALKAVEKPRHQQRPQEVW